MQVPYFSLSKNLLAITAPKAPLCTVQIGKL